jgi:hypothetical protein
VSFASFEKRHAQIVVRLPFVTVFPRDRGRRIHRAGEEHIPLVLKQRLQKRRTLAVTRLLIALSASHR